MDNQSPQNQDSPPETASPPAPMPASQTGLNQSPDKLTKKLLVPIVIVGVVVLAAVLGWFIFTSMGGYNRGTVQAEGFSYSIVFDKHAKLETDQGTKYLRGNDSATGKPILVAVSKSVHSKADCYVTDTTALISKLEIENQEHNFCYSKSANAYGMNFKHQDEWYTFVVFPKNPHDTVNEETARQIASSVKVN